MIRKFKDSDINEVLNIWLDTNIKAHHFVSAQYWQDNFAAVRDMLPKAEIYVYVNEKNKKIQSFIGLNGNYIAGIFVCEEAQSNGIGKQLLDFVKGIKTELSLRVYKRNVRAVRFYQRENFTVYSEGTDESTGEKEYVMIWGRENS